MEAIFNKLTAELGGLYSTPDLDTLKVNGRFPEEVLGLAHFRENYARLARSDDMHDSSTWVGAKSVKTYYVNNQNINAYALRDRNSGTEFVGLSYGASLKLQAYFETLVAASDFLPEIGHSEYEQFTLDDLVIDLQLLGGEKFGKIQSKCNTRRTLAGALWMCCLDFLCFHEFAHHLRGHLLLIEEKFHIHSLAEFYERKAGDKEFYGISQLLELDADRYATIMGATMSNYIHKVSQSQFGLAGISAEELHFLSSSFIFHIFDEMHIDNSFSKRKSHPHPAIRRLNVFYTIARIQSKTQLEFNKTFEAYSSLINSVESLFDKLSRFPAYRRRMRGKEVWDTLKPMYGELQVLIDGELSSQMKLRNQILVGA